MEERRSQTRPDLRQAERRWIRLIAVLAVLFTLGVGATLWLATQWYRADERATNNSDELLVINNQLKDVQEQQVCAQERQERFSIIIATVMQPTLESLIGGFVTPEELRQAQEDLAAYVDEASTEGLQCPL